MEDSRFDALTKRLGAASRRGLVGAAGVTALAALFGQEIEKEALSKGKGKRKKGKKGKKKKRKPGEPCGGETVCTGGRFCCDDERELCCNPGDSCCNIGPGTGSCCSPPNRCGRPWGNDNAPFECCPPEQQWVTSVGLVRCCPDGTEAIQNFPVTTGPCCPEDSVCGDTCCPEDRPVCVDPVMGTCCTEDNACGDSCCQGLFGDCCNGECRNSEFGPWHDCGDFCCWAETTCCGSGNNGICCNEGLVCATPCGDLPHACCTPESLANGHCCNSDCGDNCGG